jgi:probable phosphoglycerate mutase
VSPAALWLIRHAESTWNAAGRWQGQADPPLSERGRQQALGLACELRDEALERLISSDLARAAQTADILGGQLGLEVRREPLLRELDAGRWSGLTRREIEARDPEALARFDASEPAARAGGGESFSELRQRACRALAALASEHPGQRVGIVTHGGLIRALVPELRLENAGWRRIVPESGERFRAAADAVGSTSPGR